VRNPNTELEPAAPRGEERTEWLNPRATHDRGRDERPTRFAHAGRHRAGSYLRLGHRHDQRIVLTKRTPIGWFFGFAIAFCFLMLLNVTIGQPC
jgi:hypothetical protein